jgi:hypothetical protein
LKIGRGFKFSPRARLQDHVNFLHLCLCNLISNNFLAANPANTTESEAQWSERCQLLLFEFVLLLVKSSKHPQAQEEQSKICSQGLMAHGSLNHCWDDHEWDWKIGGAKLKYTWSKSRYLATRTEWTETKTRSWEGKWESQEPKTRAQKWKRDHKNEN